MLKGRSTGLLALLALLLLGTVLGCGALERPATISPQARAALAEIDRRKEVVADLELRLVAACARTQGFDVLQPTPPLVPDARPDGRLSTDFAQRSGYGLTLERGAEEESRRGLVAQTAAWNATSESYRIRLSEALYGPEGQDEVSYDFGDGSMSMSEQGCYADVGRSLYGSLPEQLELTWVTSNGIGGARSERREKGGEKVLARWRGCMAASGQPYPDPDAALAAARAAFDGTDTARAKERTIAVADATCRDETGFDEEMQKLEDEGVARYLLDHESDVIGYVDQLAEAERRGQQLLAGR